MSEVFARCATEGRGALVGYLPAGYPTVDGSVELFTAAIEGGCDLVEVGVPYSDPVMDGPTIQAAADTALRAGFRVRDVFTVVERISAAGGAAVVMIRAGADSEGHAVGILADLQGPKIRLGRFATGPGSLEWRTGEEVRITVDDVAGTHDRVSTTYKGLAADARPDDRLLVDDGKVGLRVVAVEGNDVVCRVTEGGPVSDNKGLSLPGMNVSVPAMSEKDCADLEFALGLRVDIIALSFVRSPADIDQVHKIMDDTGARLPVIAKLEKPEAVDNLEAIVWPSTGSWSPAATSAWS